MSAPGRRTTSGRGRLDPIVLLAVALPLLTLLVSLLVAGPERSGEPDPGAVDPLAPRSAPISRTTLICPSGLDRTLVSSATSRGEVTLSRPKRDQTRSVAPERVVGLSAPPGPVVLRAEGEIAAGLVAVRARTPLATAECPVPQAEQWFTGVGAGARYDSVLELVNPDAGPAVVDVTVLGRRGRVDAPKLRGLTVPGGGAVRVDLGRTIPRRDELALRVLTSRGRVLADVRGRLDRLNGASVSTDWLPAQPEPATTSRLLGVSGGGGQRTLVLANPGETQARATIRLVTPDSVFAPLDGDPVEIDPGSVLRVDVAPLLRGPDAADALGLEVESSAPLTAALRSLVADDLSFAVPGGTITGETAAVVPVGDKRLLLAGAEAEGSVRVSTTAGRGGPPKERTVEVGPGRGSSVRLPASARFLRVDPGKVEVEASVLISEGRSGTAVLRLTDLVREALVPVVRPGAPS